MAIFTRTNGDANGVVHVDVAAHGDGVGQIVSTGIGKHPTMYLIVAGVDISGETGVGGKVETVLRTLATQATVIAYQVQDDDSGEMRVLVEATGWDDAGLTTALQAISGLSGATASSSGGFAA